MTATRTAKRPLCTVFIKKISPKKRKKETMMVRIFTFRSAWIRKRRRRSRLCVDRRIRRWRCKSRSRRCRRCRTPPWQSWCRCSRSCSFRTHPVDFIIKFALENVGQVVIYLHNFVYEYLLKHTPLFFYQTLWLESSNEIEIQHSNFFNCHNYKQKNGVDLWRFS